MTRIEFVAPNNATPDALRAMGVNVGPSQLAATCPYMVGDFISFVPVPQVGYRVAWRSCLLNDPEGPRWMVGLERADHPLADPAYGAPAAR